LLSQARAGVVFTRQLVENVGELEQAKVLLCEGGRLPLEGGAAEHAPQVIHSIATGTRREIHAKLVNRGLIDNLPEGAVVEVPCVVDASRLTPVPMGALPVQCAALNRPCISVAELTVEAARLGDPVPVRQAVLMDPNASSTLTPEQIWHMCNDLVAAHGDLLPPELRPPPARELTMT